MHLLKRQPTTNTLTLETLHAHFSFIARDELCLTHTEPTSDTVTFYLTKKENETQFLASITLSTSLTFSIPTWSFASNSEDFQIQYKKLNMTPLWFSNLYKAVAEHHLSVLQHYIPRSSFSKKMWKSLLYKGNEDAYIHETSTISFSTDEWEHIYSLVQNQENN